MATLIAADGYSITFDNILEENYSDSAIVTEHPIANSANVTDHRQVNPRVITLRALVTETPFEGKENDIPLVSGERTGPRGWMYLQLVRSAANLGPMTYVSTRLGANRDYMMTRLEFSVENPLHLIFDMELKEVTFAEAQRVDLPKIKVRRTRPSACPVVKQGDRPKEEVKPPSAEDEQPPPRNISFYRNFELGLATDPEGVDIINSFFSIRR